MRVPGIRPLVTIQEETTDATGDRTIGMRNHGDPHREHFRLQSPDAAAASRGGA
jgi:hypothetical protein